MFPRGGGGNRGGLLIMGLLGSSAMGGPLGPLSWGNGGEMKPLPAASNSGGGVLGTVDFSGSLFLSFFMVVISKDSGSTGYGRKGGPGKSLG